MGLDITAYSHLERIGLHHGLDAWCTNEDHLRAFAYDAFPASFRGIPVEGAQEFGGTTFLIGGCYVPTEKTEIYRFRAGSYGGYNRWREDLATQFNPYGPSDSKDDCAHVPPDPDLPFYELIWFADNEGTIGPEAAADLLEDFREHGPAYAREHADEYDRQCYQDWMRAFRLAAHGGLVDFH